MLLYDRSQNLSSGHKKPKLSMNVIRYAVFSPVQQLDHIETLTLCSDVKPQKDIFVLFFTVPSSEKQKGHF
jgi:hypothetical protein